MPIRTNVKNTKIAFIMLAIMAVASVLSFTKPALAQDTAEPKTGMNRVIKGTENWNGKHDISVSKFLGNIGKSTGIYMMIHKDTPEEIAQKQAEKAAQEAAEANDPFEGVEAPGWQKIIMIAIGFLIIYLAVGKGFEPLLLIPIGFGTVLVNIPGANMGMAPHGMLHISYSAGV